MIRLVVTLDGAILETIDIPNTGSWVSYETVTVEEVVLAGGNNQILGIEFANGNVNVNWFKFTAPRFTGCLLQGNELVLEWTGSGALESSPDFRSDWTSIPTTGKSHTGDVTAAANLFYRIKQ